MRGPRDPEARRRAGQFGRRAEWLALVLLVGKGYWPLARNYVVKGGEIDLIMRRGRTIAFVEVKARPDVETALGVLSPQKQRRIEIAARAWLARHPYAARYTLRGDGVFLAPRRWPLHVEDAFLLRLV